MKDSNIRFVRIRGRIVPIKKKEVDGVSKVAAASGVSAASAIYAAKQIRKANFSFSRSANLRGHSKLVMGKGKVYNDFIKKSASFKVVGKGFARKGFGALALGTGIAAALATSGARDLTKDDKKRTAIAAAVTGVGLSLFGFKARIGNIVKLAKKINPKRPVKGVADLYAKEGIKKTSSTVRKFAKAKYKGSFNPKNEIYKAKQLDLIDSPKKFDVAKWLRGKLE